MSAPSSARIPVVPAALGATDDLPRCKSLGLRLPSESFGAVDHDAGKVTTTGGSFNAAQAASPSSTALDTEHDVDDECPTLRRIPLGYREPDPEKEGGIVFQDGKHHALAPGAQHLGAYTTAAQAQRRLDLFFGRKIVMSKSGVRKLPRGDR